MSAALLALTIECLGLVRSAEGPKPADRFLEIRSYKVVSGKRAEFDRLFREGVVPMLHRHGVHVVAFGPSRHDEDSYVLMRSYDSLERRKQQLEGFYGSEEWKRELDGPVTSLIETYTTVVLDVGPEAVARLAR